MQDIVSAVQRWKIQGLQVEVTAVRLSAPDVASFERAIPYPGRELPKPDSFVKRSDIIIEDPG